MLSPKIHLPFSFFHYLFLSAAAKYTPEELRNITEHELVHIKEKHSVDVLLLEALNIVFWCSPLIYFYRQSLRNVHEYLADAKVLETTSKKQYGQLLLQQFQRGPGMAMANNFIHSQLKKRIQMMTKNQSTKTARWKYFLAIPVFLALFFTFAKTDLLAQINKTNDTQEETTNAEEIDPIYKVVEEMPRFKGCEDNTEKEERKKCSQEKMLNFVYKNIKYPKIARESNIQGTAVIRFVVNKEGKVVNPEIIRPLGGGCDEEALRVVGEMPDWIPGKQGGENVDVYYHLPIKYKLETGETETLAASSHKKDMHEEDKEIIFADFEEMPRFKGCEEMTDNKAERKKCSEQKMLEFIYSNIKYPSIARESGVEGTVVARFVIDKTGKIKNPEILRSIGSGCDEEVLRVVNEMADWIPGKQRGKNVSVYYNLPVRFKLEGESKSEKTSEKKTEKTVDNYLEVKSFKMSPNPARDQVLISFEVEDYKNLSLQITDSNGRIMGTKKASFSQAKNEVQLDISAAATGMLFVILQNGDKVFTKQLMKN